jgi:hypothetical protein
LTSRPGSIAAIVSLTARSGFGELLVPYDDDRSIAQKLEGLTFRIDRRTGAIVADDKWRYDMKQDDTTTSLLSASSSSGEVIELYSSSHGKV